MSRRAHPADVYSMWHQKTVDHVQEMTVRLPRRLTRLGRGDRIVYASDKWERDGDVHTYQHEFTSGPDVFVGDKRGEIDTRDFLGIESLTECQLDWIHLGSVEELKVRPDAGKKQVLKFEHQPFLCATPEKDTLVVMSTRLFFVRGGSMTVTERGIVR